MRETFGHSPDPSFHDRPARLTTACLCGALVQVWTHETIAKAVRRHNATQRHVGWWETVKYAWQGEEPS